ncbi:MAG: hypothetical protein FJ390_03760 [Verrucomicrobia bacterium]|nr:hypothetical protein [Verrucomicrobiota bacterium]
MPTFYYSQNQNSPPPPAYMQAAAPSAAANKWYDSNRTWGEYWQQWENYSGYGKKKPDNLPYDHAFPFGVDPNDPSKPYAPYGFYYDDKGNVTTTPYVQWGETGVLENGIKHHPDASDLQSPLNVYNVDSPMDPYNVQQFFYAAKPGSPWHQYERKPDQMAPWEEGPTQGKIGELTQWAQPSLPGYIKYSDTYVSFKDTPENFPWLHDEDASHHYRNANPSGSTYMLLFFGPTQPQPNITEKIYLDSPVAPAGWQAVGSDNAGNSSAQ